MENGSHVFLFNFEDRDRKTVRDIETLFDDELVFALKTSNLDNFERKKLNKKITTILFLIEKPVYGFLNSELEKNRWCLIEALKNLDAKFLKSSGQSNIGLTESCLNVVRCYKELKK